MIPVIIGALGMVPETLAKRRGSFTNQRKNGDSPNDNIFLEISLEYPEEFLRPEKTCCHSDSRHNRVRKIIQLELRKKLKFE